MPRGGRRTGAGAPKGNVNALKTGAYSARVQTVIRILMAEPETHGIIERLVARGRHHVTDFAADIARDARPAREGRARATVTDVTDREPLPAADASLPIEARIAARIRQARAITDEARIIDHQEAYLVWAESQPFIPFDDDFRHAITPFHPDYDPDDPINQSRYGRRRSRSVRPRFGAK